MRRLTFEDRVANRLKREMEEHGSVAEFCEKLVTFPEQYIRELALAAVDEIEDPGVDL